MKSLIQLRTELSHCYHVYRLIHQFFSLSQSLSQDSSTGFLEFSGFERVVYLQPLHTIIKPKTYRHGGRVSKETMSGPHAPVPKPVKKTSSNPSSKKRKAPADPEPAESKKTAQGDGMPGPSNKRPKQKKTPTHKDATLDALLDLDNGVNTIFAKMDPDLLADYVAAQTKRFGGEDLSVVELSDLYVPVGAIRDTIAATTTTTTSPERPRTKENLAAFLEENVGGDELERKRLGTAPKACGAPHTIIVAGAGLRAADLVR